MKTLSELISYSVSIENKQERREIKRWLVRENNSQYYSRKEFSLVVGAATTSKNWYVKKFKNVAS
jgi:hypothetical protein